MSTHRVIVNTTDGRTAEVFHGDEASCAQAIRHLPGQPFVDQDGRQVSTVDRAWVEETATE